MEKDHKGKVSVVVGITGGMGGVIADRLSSLGMDVCGMAIEDGVKPELKERIESHDTAFGYYQTDITDDDSVAASMKAVFDNNGRIDMLVNAAGIGVLNKLEDLSAEDIHRTIDINLKGTIFTTRNVIQYMSKTGGNIINISSMSGVRGIPDPVNSNGIYTASKFGVNGFSECMEKYLLQYGIYVTTFCPGATATPWWDTWSHSFGKDKMIPTEYIADVIELILNTPEGVLFKQLRVLPAAEADLF
jgi:NAD(P)-dependent dehydrogenase (short-subunit alcohol dehydrogenase family)